MDIPGAACLAGLFAASMALSRLLGMVSADLWGCSETLLVPKSQVVGQRYVGR